MSEKFPADHDARILLLINWRRRAIRASCGHYHFSNQCKFWGNFLTCFNMLSAISVLFLSNNRFFEVVDLGEPLSTSIFKNSDFYTAIASLFVVLTTALQYVLKLELKTRDAKSAGNDFTSIKREIELALVADDVAIDRLHAIQVSHTHSSRHHELVPKSVWISSDGQATKAFKEDELFENSILRRYNIIIKPNEDVSLVVTG